MSLWTVIGLPDRRSVDKLMEEFQNLRIENQVLMAENQKLLLAQTNDIHTGLLNAQEKGKHQILQSILETYKRMCMNIERITAQNEQKIKDDGESIKEALAFSIKQADEKLSELKKDVDMIIKGQNNIQEDLESKYNAVTAEIQRLKKYLTEASRHTEQVFLENQKIVISGITDFDRSHHELALQIEKNCTAAFEKIQMTSNKYQMMEADEQDNLNKIKELSSELMTLSDHQRTVMEQLSQLCQDSDQFMEMQKSINDIWEIMKVVWVDSLLNDYKKQIE